ncbi:MAG TPA: DoxX family protein [Stellaceae bacterium]
MSLNDTAAPRLAIPALGGLYDALAPYSYPLIRFATGAILVPHGYGKLFHGGVTGLAGMLDKMGFHPSMIWAYWVGGLEFFGAIMLAIGLLTRPVALMLFIEMVVIVFGVHISQGYLWTNRGVEYPLLLGILCLAIFFRGGDRLSVDRALGREL